MPRKQLQPAQRSMNHEPLLTVAKSLAECLVSHPELLRFEVDESNEHVIITINGHRDDVGKLMGKDCKNVKAVQAILQLITERDAKLARVTIGEGWYGNKGDARPRPTELFDNLAMRRLGSVARVLFPSATLNKAWESAKLTITITTSPAASSEIQPCLQTVLKAFGAIHGRFVAVEVVEGTSNESVAA
jgi:predicted RNA-binding protein YlqC (UPF0109 family)